MKLFRANYRGDNVPVFKVVTSIVTVYSKESSKWKFLGKYPIDFLPEIYYLHLNLTPLTNTLNDKSGTHLHLKC